MVKPFPLSNLLCQLLLLVFCLVAAGRVHAENAPAFPSDPNAWINSGPLTISGLKGKGIVLWFFEEASDKCRARWPELMKTAEKCEGQPVVFIAVNSGNPRAAVDAYVQEVGVKAPWLVLVDPNRDFEKACQLIKEISPGDDESQIRYIKPDGEILPGLTDDIEEAAKKALEGAEWKMSPRGLPESMRATWLAVEIGNYKGLAAPLKKAMASPKTDIKETGKSLMDIVQKEMNEYLTTIKEAQEAGNSFKAYEAVTELSDHFMGFELPKEIATLKKDLSKDAKVKAGISATKTLEAVRKQLANAESGGKNKAHDKAMKVLDKIIADFPETSLARQAKGLKDYSE